MAINLSNAKRNREDEFYTQLTDVEKELKHYREHFNDKHIFLNCDDPEFSSFWRYFALNFKQLNIKQLTSTHFSETESSYRMDMYREIPEDALSKPTMMTLEEIGIELPLAYITPLEDDGDFRSEESINILKEADTVVTNPPFSLFREYVAQLIEYDKDFLIIGSQNNITYKEIFPLLQDNKMWVGNNYGDMEFRVPEYYEPRNTRFRIDEKGQKWRSLGNITWFTNLDHDKRHEDLILYKKYNEDEYPKYDFYDAINVDKVKEIPMDYNGKMGVPITFMNTYNPEQFEIIGLDRYVSDNPQFGRRFLLNGKEKYARIVIRKR